MYKSRSIFILLVILFSFSLQDNAAQQVHTVKFYGKEFFILEGTAIPDSLKENRYDRLPLSYKEHVRPPVWNLSKSSAGLSIRFITNSSSINVKWEVLNDVKMNHMAETGIKGIDLYCRSGKNWQYVNTARPTGKLNEYSLVENMPVEDREFKMYLPLYDGLLNLAVGVDSRSDIRKPAKSIQKPIVFYGTSITQGGCASRPGMVYSNIISRKLDVDCINYGFSGNGRMEAPVAEVMAGIDASFYVIDCVPNMSAEEIHNNMIPLVDILREKNPVIPIVFVESIYFQSKLASRKTCNRFVWSAMKSDIIPVNFLFFRTQAITIG